MKQLNLREIHKLYLLLRNCLPEHEEQYLIDEIEVMIGRMENGRILVRAIEIMYPKAKFDKRNPLKILSMFIRGLKTNEFFEYVSFINQIKQAKKRG